MEKQINSSLLEYQNKIVKEELDIVLSDKETQELIVTRGGINVLYWLIAGLLILLCFAIELRECIYG